MKTSKKEIRRYTLTGEVEDTRVEIPVESESALIEDGKLYLSGESLLDLDASFELEEIKDN